MRLFTCESLVAQSCPTLCDPKDCSPPGSSIHGIFQAEVLEWVATSSSSGSSWPRNRTCVSRVVGRRFYHLSHQGSPIIHLVRTKKLQPLRWETWIFFFSCCKTSPKHAGSWWQSLPAGSISLPTWEETSWNFLSNGTPFWTYGKQKRYPPPSKAPSANWTSPVFEGIPKPLSHFQICQQILNPLPSSDHYRNTESDLPTDWDWDK